MTPSFTFYELFAGAGMARAGLGPRWRCIFANDLDAKKGQAYTANWGGGELLVGDIGGITTAHLPGRADLLWGSFPCQDLSIAGARAGLEGKRSGALHALWGIVNGLRKECRAPKLIVLENVTGALNSKSGEDFRAICQGLTRAGYRFGALIIDAELFVPQSRKRVFIVGARADLHIPRNLYSQEQDEGAPRMVQNAMHQLPVETKKALVWWRIPVPTKRTINLEETLEQEIHEAAWHTQQQTAQLIDMMTPTNKAKINAARSGGGRTIGTIYKRTRRNGNGEKTQRAEVRFDGVAGCLRASNGGSSRQIIIVIEGGAVRSRLLSVREAARLMGLPDSYAIPLTNTAAHHMLGDGVVVPVVRHLAAHLLEHILI